MGPKKCRRLLRAAGMLGKKIRPACVGGLLCGATIDQKNMPIVSTMTSAKLATSIDSSPGPSPPSRRRLPMFHF